LYISPTTPPFGHPSSGRRGVPCGWIAQPIPLLPEEGCPKGGVVGESYLKSSFPTSKEYEKDYNYFVPVIRLNIECKCPNPTNF